MNQEELAKKLEKVQRQSRQSTETLFVNALKAAYGGRFHSVQNDAALAYDRFRRRGTFSERTFKALSWYVGDHTDHPKAEPDLELEAA